MRLCKACSFPVSVVTPRCARCHRSWPGLSRRALRRNLARYGAALALITLLAAFALAF